VCVCVCVCAVTLCGYVGNVYCVSVVIGYHNQSSVRGQGSFNSCV